MSKLKNVTAKEGIAIGTEPFTAVATVYEHTNTQGNLYVFHAKKGHVSVF